VSLLSLLALIAGACIAVQAAMNAQLGMALNSSVTATGYAFLTSFLLVALISAAQWQPLPENFTHRAPWYTWFSFVFSVVGVASFYFLIPKMGVGNMMSFALTGQIILAMVISHYGLFASPVKLINSTKLLGLLLMVVGIILINRD